MKKLAPHENYCSQLVAKAWKKIRDSKLVGGKKIGKCPEVVFKELDGNVNGQAIPDIELNISRLRIARPGAVPLLPCAKFFMSPTAA